MISAAATMPAAGRVAAARPRSALWALGLPLGLAYLAFFLAPLMMLLAVSFYEDDRLTTMGPGQWQRFLGDAFHWKVITDTLLLGIKTVCATVLLGYPLALLYRELSPFWQRALLFVAVLAVLIWLSERALNSPWGRMMRAIRDNEVSAAAMGKDVNRRRLEMFVLGNVIIGIGGAALVTFTSIFDPSAFVPLNHTFLIWVMVILGGAGNNLGTVFGVVLVYIIWTMSEPAALFLFGQIAQWGDALFGWKAPADFSTRALQMRVFVIGLTITLVLRFAPNGLLPEKPVKYE